MKAMIPHHSIAILTSTRARIHPAWFVAVIAFVALVGAAGFRATPSVMLRPLHDEFGWSLGTISAAVSINLLLYGVTAPFAAALMEKFGIRRFAVEPCLARVDAEARRMVEDHHRQVNQRSAHGPCCPWPGEVTAPTVPFHPSSSP